LADIVEKLAGLTILSPRLPYPSICRQFHNEGRRMNLIEERVAMARAGTNPFVISRLASGWLVIGDVQPLPGYCLLLADPVVPSLNALGPHERLAFLSDMALVGDALLEVTGCARVNYEIWGNSEPALHAHIMPRYASEPDGKRHLPACIGYSWRDAPKSSEGVYATLVEKLREVTGLTRHRLTDTQAPG
jgi:diadenosine tetraphosphate (Ap4A) HIT family hydrolase